MNSIAPQTARRSVYWHQLFWGQQHIEVTTIKIPAASILFSAQLFFYYDLFFFKFIFLAFQAIFRFIWHSLYFEKKSLLHIRTRKVPKSCMLKQKTSPGNEPNGIRNNAQGYWLRESCICISCSRFIRNALKHTWTGFNLTVPI